MKNIDIIKTLETGNQEDIAALIKKLKQEELEKVQSTDRKKAISIIKKLAKKVSRNVLSGMKRLDDGYYFTDAYIIVKSNDQLIDLADENEALYPNLKPIVDRIGTDEVLEATDINYQELCFNYSKDKNSVADYQCKDGITRTIKNEYVKLALDFLGTDIIIVGHSDKAKSLQPIAFKNLHTGEFVLISVIRRN